MKVGNTSADIYAERLYGLEDQLVCRFKILTLSATNFKLHTSLSSNPDNLPAKRSIFTPTSPLHTNPIQHLPLHHQYYNTTLQLMKAPVFLNFQPYQCSVVVLDSFCTFLSYLSNNFITYSVTILKYSQCIFTCIFSLDKHFHKIRSLLYHTLSFVNVNIPTVCR